MDSSDPSGNESLTGVDEDLYTMSSDHIRLGKEYDEAATDLLEHKEILAYILHRYVSEFFDLTYKETYEWLVSLDQGRSSLVESVATAFKGIVFDIFFSLMTVFDKLIYVNIEIQHQNPGYPLINRARFYNSHIIKRQRRVISDFSYEKLCKSYSIWFIVDRFKKQADQIEKMEDDISSVILIYLGPENDAFLYKLLSTTISYKEKVKAFKKEHIYYSNDILEEVKTMCNLSEHIFLEGQASTLLKQLSKKLGTISDGLTEKIQKCNESQLDIITYAIFDINSEADIDGILNDTLN